MADDTNTPQSSDSSEAASRGRFTRNPREVRRSSDGDQRQAGQRDTGGFRIRLSDNELQAAKALQEAFGLRSTVAVLGFALRTLAQQLEAGQLAELVAQQRSEESQRVPSPRAGSGGAERDTRRGEPRAASGGGGRAQRIDPFARPSRPVAESQQPLVSDEQLIVSDEQPETTVLETDAEQAAAEPLPLEAAEAAAEPLPADPAVSSSEA